MSDQDEQERGRRRKTGIILTWVLVGLWMLAAGFFFAQFGSNWGMGLTFALALLLFIFVLPRLIDMGR